MRVILVQACLLVFTFNSFSQDVIPARQIPLSNPNPGSMDYADGKLYVADVYNNNTQKVSVIDVSRRGEERVINEISTPINPVDVEVHLGKIYVVPQTGGPIRFRDLAGGPWRRIPVPNNHSYFNYGGMLYPVPGDPTLMIVLQTSENRFHVVDLISEEVVQTVNTSFGTGGVSSSSQSDYLYRRTTCSFLTWA